MAWRIKRVVKLARVTGDAAFRDYDNRSTARTKAIADGYIAKAEANLGQLHRPAPLRRRRAHATAAGP
jgi:hypothetical protein